MKPRTVILCLESAVTSDIRVAVAVVTNAERGPLLGLPGGLGLQQVKHLLIIDLVERHPHAILETVLCSGF